MAVTANNPAASDTRRDPFVLVVYSRENCHLCQDMIAALRELQVRPSFHLEVVDVDSDEALRSRFGLKVPVLVAEGEEICHYHLDPVALDAYFAKIR
jgi:glutaredoxin